MSILIKIPLSLFSLIGFLAEASENLPQIPTAEEMEGQVLWLNQAQGQYLPVSAGQGFSQSTEIFLSADSQFIFSCPQGIAGRVSGPAKLILGPAKNNRYEAHLKSGTIAILLDPERPRGSPQFAVRTKDGVALAKGTFYAITEYKGQSFVKVKTGSIKSKPKPPIKRNFAAYKKMDIGKSSKK